MNRTNEAAFETVIEAHLLQNDYARVEPEGFDRERAIFPETACEDDPNVERKKAAQALARFMRLHPHNIAQKTEVMVEHFQAVTRHKIGGRAKAMVVTGSRLEAVRYKQSFDRYIQEKGYAIKTLVAFSGTVQDDQLADVTYTEVGMNHGISEKELRRGEVSDRFRSAAAPHDVR